MADDRKRVRRPVGSLVGPGGTGSCSSKRRSLLNQRHCLRVTLCGLRIDKGDLPGGEHAEALSLGEQLEGRGEEEEVEEGGETAVGEHVDEVGEQ